MSKRDLQARPIFHHKRAPIEAHLTVVLPALAVTRHIEAVTGMSIKKFVTTHCREVVIAAGDQLITAADPLPDELSDAINAIGTEGCAQIEPVRTRTAPTDKQRHRSMQ